MKYIIEGKIRRFDDAPWVKQASNSLERTPIVAFSADEFAVPPQSNVDESFVKGVKIHMYPYFDWAIYIRLENQNEKFFGDSEPWIFNLEEFLTRIYKSKFGIEPPGFIISETNLAGTISREERDAKKFVFKKEENSPG